MHGSEIRHLLSDRQTGYKAGTKARMSLPLQLVLLLLTMVSKAHSLESFDPTMANYVSNTVVKAVAQGQASTVLLWNTQNDLLANVPKIVLSTGGMKKFYPNLGQLSFSHSFKRLHGHHQQSRHHSRRHD